jgi:D-tagatose-1,6-bisphosphate aldolase subunit GatZ/KbaZ
LDSQHITRTLLKTVRSNLAGSREGLYSICSANRHVLETGMLHARGHGSRVCIESTSNQVNQYGGYMGMTAADFAGYVKRIAADVGFPADRIVLGGDHLGPHVWQKEPSISAMEKAGVLVRSYALAGYVKIHLDASMKCGDDPGGTGTPLTDETVAERAAALCRIAEDAHSEMPEGSPAPVYVIGTEVPPPGGEQIEGLAPSATAPSDLERTVSVSRRAFASKGLESAWDRVIGVVVQPGVEFGDNSILEYDRGKARGLSQYLESSGWHFVFEAHSTDYQLPEGLRQMVEDHFAILKVGPWLTFAFREAVFALAEMEREWLSAKKGAALSCLRESLEEAMLRNPVYWRGYYGGDDAALQFARKYSYSDRSRYYWPDPQVQNALGILVRNLSESPPPLTLLSQYMPAQYEAVRNGTLRNLPDDLIHSKIREVVDIYARATSMR